MRRSAFLDDLGARMLGLNRFNPEKPEPSSSPIVKRIICLANSRKRSGRCVAGKETTANGNAWVRPVSARPDLEIARHEQTYRDGTELRVLDVVDIPLHSHQPKVHQTENWLFSPNSTWVRIGRAGSHDILPLIDTPDRLWKLGSHTYHGWNDRVSVAECHRLNNSLFLVHLERLKLHVSTPGAELGRNERRVQGKFRYNDAYYQMWITDPRVERTYFHKPDGEYDLADCFVTVNLSEPLLGYCHKLIVGVIPRQTDDAGP